MVIDLITEAWTAAALAWSESGRGEGAWDCPEAPASQAWQHSSEASRDQGVEGDEPHQPGPLLHRHRRHLGACLHVLRGGWQGQEQGGSKVHQLWRHRGAALVGGQGPAAPQGAGTPSPKHSKSTPSGMSRLQDRIAQRSADNDSSQGAGIQRSLGAAQPHLHGVHRLGVGAAAPGVSRHDVPNAQPHDVAAAALQRVLTVCNQ